MFFFCSTVETISRSSLRVSGAMSNISSWPVT